MAEFDPIPDPPTPEEIATRQGKAIIDNLRIAVLAGVAVSGQCARLALDLCAKDSHHVEKLGQLVATASTALECAERAQRLIATSNGEPK